MKTKYHFIKQAYDRFLHVCLLQCEINEPVV